MIKTKKQRGRFIFCVLVIPVIIGMTFLLLYIEPWQYIAATYAAFMALMKFIFFLDGWIERGEG